MDEAEVWQQEIHDVKIEVEILLKIHRYSGAF